VGDKQSLAGREPHYEALMPAAIVVIRQDLRDHTLPVDLKIASAIVERARERLIALTLRSSMLVSSIELAKSDVGSDNKSGDCYEQTLHRACDLRNAEFVIAPRSRMRMYGIDPVDFFGRLGRLDIEIDDNRLLTASHENATQNLVSCPSFIL
jgi:hypothetical protein